MRIFRKWGTSTTIFFTYTHWSHDLCLGLIVPLMPFIRSDLGLSYLQSGLLFSAFAITSGLSQFIGGWVGDRISQRLVVAIGLGGVGVATLAVGLASAYHPMLVILVVMGVLSGAYHPSILSMLSRFFKMDSIGRVISIYMLGGVLGFALAPLLGSLIAERIGWQFAFIIFAIPAMLASPLAFKRFKREPHIASSELTGNVSNRDAGIGMQMSKSIGIRQALRIVAPILILIALSQLIAGSAVAFIPMYFIEKHNITATYAAILMGVIRVSGLAGSLFGGWLSDKWGRIKAIILVLLLTGPTLYLLTLLPVNAFLILGLVVFGLVWIMRQTTVQPYLMDVTPPHLRATIFGIYFGLSMESMTVAQPIVGHFMDIFGIVEVMHLIALISIALSVMSLLLVLKK